MKEVHNSEKPILYWFIKLKNVIKRMNFQDHYDQLFLLEDKSESLSIRSEADPQVNESDTQLQAQDNENQFKITEDDLFSGSHPRSKPALNPTTSKVLLKGQYLIEILN